MKFIANPVEVDAFVITELGKSDFAGLMVKLDDGSDRLVTPEQMARFEPAVGDYFVVQSDGYIYVNPKDVFERKYSSMPTDYLDLRRQIGDFRSTFYGPHKCQWCDATVIKQAAEQGGVPWVLIEGESKYMVHREPVKVTHAT